VTSSTSKSGEAGKLADAAAKEKQILPPMRRGSRGKGGPGEAGLKLLRKQRDTQKAPEILIYEFLGSLLTGILVSIGAPYCMTYCKLVLTAVYRVQGEGVSDDQGANRT